MLLLLLPLISRVLALDITTLDGRTYRGCTITQVEPDALRIMHTDGAARIPYDKLPPAMQKQYFDPVKVAAYREQVEEARRAAAVKAEEDRRQQAIAAAQAEEQREQEAEARQREADEKKAAAQKAEEQRLATEHLEKLFLIGLMVAAWLVGIYVYFLPTIIGRHKTNALAIFILNFFLGWTFLGWVLALVWAFTKDSAMEELARQHMNRPPVPPNPRPLREYNSRQVEDGRYLE